MKKKVNEIAIEIEKRAEQRYKLAFLVDGQRCFLYGDSHYFLITGLDWKHPAIVVEHAHTLNDAKKNLFEDGDLFYIDDMTEDEIFGAIVREVEAHT